MPNNMKLSFPLTSSAFILLGAVPGVFSLEEYKLRGSSAAVASFDKVLHSASAAIVGGSHKEDECEDYPKKSTDWCKKAYTECCSTKKDYDDNDDFCDFYGFDEHKGIVGDTPWTFSTDDVDCNKCGDEKCDDNDKKHDDNDDDDNYDKKHDDDDDDDKKHDDDDDDDKDDKKHDDDDDDDKKHDDDDNDDKDDKKHDDDDKDKKHDDKDDEDKDNKDDKKDKKEDKKEDKKDGGGGGGGPHGPKPVHGDLFTPLMSE